MRQLVVAVHHQAGVAFAQSKGIAQPEVITPLTVRYRLSGIRTETTVHLIPGIWALPHREAVEVEAGVRIAEALGARIVRWL